ncbi:NTP transferase domain-containing protein [Agrobacterium sp. ES01]|uniref:NTP transferase domain-containing protein n=1 Tax=Agrobacterium sp. ES01 TaxID=3420714 RepID=UPI003D1198C9
MIFGEIATNAAEGAILAHSVTLKDGKLKKGHRLEYRDIERLLSERVASVIVSRLEDGDLSEDLAADILASALVRPGVRAAPPATGRVNFHATENGLFVANKALIDRFNAVDPAITLACLADHSNVRQGDMIATIKIIPLAVPATAVEAALAVLTEGSVIQVKLFIQHHVSLIATELPSLKSSVMDKTTRLLEQRLAGFGSRLTDEIRVAHRAQAVADAIGDALADRSRHKRMVVVFGASAVSDDGDVIPQAIRLAGGKVERVGLPIDPGNLLVLGFVGDVPVVGAPGCARSPKENGFDWVLARLLAGEHPTSAELATLGVGGLLMEIASRPQPREVATDARSAISITAVLLAAGKSSRMGGPHKLLAEFDDMPLVRRVAQAALSSGLESVVVVTGHRADEIDAALEGLPLTLVHNLDYESGMAGSLRAGFTLPESADADGVLVLLGDMPGVDAEAIRALVFAFRNSGGRAIVRAVAGGKRGNPVILPKSTFGAVTKLEGDIGARAIIESSGLEIIDVEIGLNARLDVDTQDAVIAAGGVLKG